MKRILPFISIVFMFSCSETSQEEKTELLSSIIWTTEKTPDSNEFHSTFEFGSDGSYILIADEIVVNGQWSWVNDDEIFLELKGLTFNKKATKFDHKSNNYFIRIIELNESIFKTIERHESDDWDSEFAKNIIYIPN